jgi:26S proteasome non-ATPase regulatory subunit 10
MDNGQDSYGNTALHAACEEERQEVAKLLISHGASREIQNREKKKSS